MQKVILLGAGGHCRAVLDTIKELRNFKVTGILDQADKIGLKVLGVPVVGTDRELGEYLKNGIKNCIITVGSTENAERRIALYRLAKKAGFSFPNVISPAARVSKYAQLGEGNYLAPGVIVNAGTRIGFGCIINTGALLDHDCVVGDFVHIAPGVAMSGGVQIGDRVHVGTGTAVIQGVKIGHDSIIGVGSAVVTDIGPDCVAYGIPCRKKSRNE